MKAPTPSDGSLTKEADKSVTGEKACPVTRMPATSTVSVKTGPWTTWPSSYVILKFPDCGLLVVEMVGSYLDFFSHAALVQLTEGTQKSEDPARKNG